MIPWNELALGFARGTAYEKGFNDGTDSQRLFEIHQNDTQNKLTGWAARTAVTKNPGWNIWNPDNQNEYPISTNVEGVRDRLESFFTGASTKVLKLPPKIKPRENKSPSPTKKQRGRPKSEYTTVTALSQKPSAWFEQNKTDTLSLNDNNSSIRYDIDYVEVIHPETAARLFLAHKVKATTMYQEEEDILAGHE
jgi:hypothetical protein